MASVAPLSPYHDDHAGPQVPHADHPLFSIVETLVDHIERLGLEDFCRVFKGEAAVGERSIPLTAVKRYPNVIYCIPKKVTREQFFVSPRISST
jgi:hypothetical protein